MGTRGDAMQRATHAWHLRVLGKTWNEIADTVGFANDANAIRAVRRYLGRLPEPDVEESRTMWRARMEHLWSAAARDAEVGRPGAIRAGVAVAQRAAALDGLDAPTRYEITPAEAQLEYLVEQLMARTGHERTVEADVLELEVLPDE